MRSFRGQRDMIVDPDGTKFQLRREPHGTSNVLRKDRSRESIKHVVALRQCVGFIFKLLNCDYWSEDFVLNNFPILFDICQYGRSVVIALIESHWHTTARQNFGALQLGSLHESRNPFAL